MSTRTVECAPEDALTLRIDLAGFFGFDLQTVAGRELAKEKMLASCVQHIDTFLESVSVVEKKDRRARQP